MAGESALVVTVPAAEPATSRVRRWLDPSCRAGMPAHVTVLYPFLAPEAIGEQVLETLGELFSGCEAFRFELGELGWFGERVLYLAPSPQQPFASLTAAACAAFPGHRPYGGAFDEVVPHLTVAARGPAPLLRTLGTRLARTLPVRAEALAVTLLVTGPPPKGWRVLGSFPLGSTGRDPSAPAPAGGEAGPASPGSSPPPTGPRVGERRPGH